MNREFPIIRFEQRSQDNAKTPGGGNNDKPKFTLRGEELSHRRDILVEQLQDVLANWDKDIIEGVPRIIEINYIEEAKAKSHQAKIINMFKDYNKDTQIGAKSNNGIVIQLNSTNQLEESISSFQSFEENDVAISAIENVQRYQPTVLGGENDDYNLTFWNFMDYAKNENVVNKVEESLKENKIEYEKSSFGGGEVVIEVSNVTTDKLEFIKKLPIKHIEPTEKTEFPFPDLETFELDLKKVEFNPERTYTVIGLLDSGVEINEYTRNWVTKGNGSFYEDTELNKTHGTYIASLLIHGDSFNDTSDFFVEGCRLVDVPIVPGHPIDSKLLIRNIENAIIQNEEIKIWNLSVGLDREINENKFSNFAKELDRIQYENDVLIFKSAGNDDAFFLGVKRGNYIMELIPLELLP
ncbi:S8 family serine peptidase [Salinicoccus sp. CNSTN-B1]